MNHKDLISEENKKEIDNNNNSFKPLIKLTFTITYTIIIITLAIVITEAFQTKIPHIRYIFSLETCILLIAGYFYTKFNSTIDNCYKNNVEIDWNEIVKIRYVDWTFTTPIMLLLLVSVLQYNSGKTDQHIPTIIGIILLNGLMMLSGYLGEIGIISRIAGVIIGFIFFFIIFGMIYKNYLQPKYIIENYILFALYIVVWGMYGIVYMFENNLKNILMTVFDLIAKCFVGLGLWIYYMYTHKNMHMHDNKNIIINIILKCIVAFAIWKIYTLF